MADTFDELVKALAMADTAVEGSDPYAIPGSVVNSVNWNPSDYGAGENLAAGAAKGFLAGLFGGLGTEYKQRAADEYRNVLAAKALGVKTPENKVLPEDLFKKANTVADLLTVKQGLDTLKENKAMAAKAQLDALQSEQDLKDYEAKLKLKQQYDNKDSKEAAKLLQKEEQTKQKLEQAFKFVDDVFEQTKDVGMLEGALSSDYLPKTRGGERIASAGNELLAIADSIKGMEINDQARKALLLSTPRWNDSPETKEEKKIQFKKLLAALATTSGKNAPVDASDLIGGGYRESKAGNYQPMDSQSNSLPTTGSTFMGYKVLSVKKKAE